MSMRVLSLFSRNVNCRAIRRINVLQNHLVLRPMSASISAPDDDVIIDKIDDKGVITLNRPKALNALDLSMIRKIYPYVKKWNDEALVKFVIIKGAGDKAFCAGGDIRAIAEAKSKSDKSVQKDFFREEYVLNNAIGTLCVPWIAFMNGITMGGVKNLNLVDSNKLKLN